PLVVHVVEGRHLVHRDRLDADVGGQRGLGFGADPALLLLDDGQAGHHRGDALFGGVLGDFAVEARDGGAGKLKGGAHRSISPKTMSMVPMMATASASMWPRAISSSAARWAKPGARIFR